MAVKKAASEEKVAEKKTSAKKTVAAKAAESVEKKVAEKNPAARKTAAKKAAEIVIQSPLGGEITSADILARVGNADKIYVRVDENKAYWVRGEEGGSIDLW